MASGAVQVNKEAETEGQFYHFLRDYGLSVRFGMRNCYKLALQLKVKIVRKNCELFVRSMNGAWLDQVRGRGRLEYRLLLIRIFLDGLMR